MEERLLPRAYAAIESGYGSTALVHGPPGCGKTMLLKRVAGQVPWACIWLEVPTAHQRVGGAEASLHTQLEAARAAAPCLLLIDELHALAPASACAGSPEHRLVLQLADGVQGLRGTPVFVLAACRVLDSVHPALRRNGRLHHTVAIRTPSPEQRLEILRGITQRLRPADERTAEFDRQLEMVASEAHGLCGAQLVGVCQQAMMGAWRRRDGEAAETAASLNALVARDAGGDAADAASAGHAPATADAPSPANAKDEGCHQLPGAASTAAGAIPTEEEWREALESMRAVTLSSVGLGATTSAMSSQPPGNRAARAASQGTLQLLPAGAELYASVVVPLREPQTYARLGVTPPRGVLLHVMATGLQPLFGSSNPYLVAPEYSFMPTPESAHACVMPTPK